VLPEALADGILAIVELEQLLGKIVKGWEINLPLKAAHAKPRISKGRVGELFSHPVKSMT
jgi:hypothetical protein